MARHGPGFEPETSDGAVRPRLVGRRFRRRRRRRLDLGVGIFRRFLRQVFFGNWSGDTWSDLSGNFREPFGEKNYAHHWVTICFNNYVILIIPELQPLKNVTLPIELK